MNQAHVFSFDLHNSISAWPKKGRTDNLYHISAGNFIFTTTDDFSQTENCIRDEQPRPINTEIQNELNSLDIFCKEIR